MGAARQRREEERKRWEMLSVLEIFVSYKILKLCTAHVRVLLDGLYDPDSPLYDLLGARHVVMNEVWQVLKKDWEVFHEQ